VKSRVLLIVMVVGLLSGCGGARPLRVFAAVSTRECVEEIGRDFQRETGVVVEVTPAGSDQLATQIEAGAEADLFLSADEAWADHLEERGLSSARRDLLGNRLVVVAPRDGVEAINGLKELAGGRIRRLALAAGTVPAGRYARQSLRSAGVWDGLAGRVQIVEGDSVRSVLLYVARGEVDAGFVYATDAAADARVRVIYAAPEDGHAPIRYPLVTIRRAAAHPAAARFADHLAGPAARAVFERAGFSVVP
jgi:molybdate transport system substrate-binding protein